MVEVVSFRNVGIIEVASSGHSFRLEINGLVYYISRDKLLDVNAGRRSYTEVSIIQKHDAEDEAIVGDPRTPQSSEVAAQIRHQVLMMNADLRKP